MALFIVLHLIHLCSEVFRTLQGLLCVVSCGEKEAVCRECIVSWCSIRLAQLQMRRWSHARVAVIWKVGIFFPESSCGGVLTQESSLSCYYSRVFSGKAPLCKPCLGVTSHLCESCCVWTHLRVTASVFKGFCLRCYSHRHFFVWSHLSATSAGDASEIATATTLFLSMENCHTWRMTWYSSSLIRNHQPSLSSFVQSLHSSSFASLTVFHSSSFIVIHQHRPSNAFLLSSFA